MYSRSNVAQRRPRVRDTRNASEPNWWRSEATRTIAYTRYTDDARNRTTVRSTSSIGIWRSSTARGRSWSAVVLPSPRRLGRSHAAPTSSIATWTGWSGVHTRTECCGSCIRVFPMEQPPELLLRSHVAWRVLRPNWAVVDTISHRRPTPRTTETR